MAGTIETVDDGRPAERSTAPEPLTFEPPGSGSWQLDKGHIPRPCTRFHAEVVPAAFAEGFAETFSRYGIPAGTMQQALVHGFSYSQIAPLEPTAFEARAGAAEETFAIKRWRLDLDRWDNADKPAAVARHRELGDVDVDGITVDELIAHVLACHEHAVTMIVQHHRFNGAAMLPLGDFLAHASDWTGLEHADLVGLFAGASPISTGGCPELRDAADAVRADDRSRVVLDHPGDPADVLTQLRQQHREVDAWVGLAGHRILDGFDVNHPRAIERPAVLISCLRNAVTAERAERDALSGDLAAVRERVPAEHSAAFDELYAEAKLTYRLRDERGIYSDATSFGLMRRAMLAAGVRLVVAGTLDSPELATEASTDELVALLTDDASSAPTAQELQRRRRFRAEHTVADAPLVLGDPPSPPPPFDLLPPDMARATRAIRTVSAAMGAPPQAEDTTGDRLLRGLPASPGVHQGTARIVHHIDDLDRVEPGDVIVAITTGESFNMALSLASAVVTDQGGILAHAAILAREYAIPAVVGTESATIRIRDGAEVRVDGTAGEVTW